MITAVTTTTPISVPGTDQLNLRNQRWEAAVGRRHGWHDPRVGRWRALDRAQERYHQRPDLDLWDQRLWAVGADGTILAARGKRVHESDFNSTLHWDNRMSPWCRHAGQHSLESRVQKVSEGRRNEYTAIKMTATRPCKLRGVPTPKSDD